jgi:hypothetical protein
MATTTTTIQQLGLVPAPRGEAFPPATQSTLTNNTPGVSSCCHRAPGSNLHSTVPRGEVFPPATQELESPTQLHTTAPRGEVFPPATQEHESPTQLHTTAPRGEVFPPTNLPPASRRHIADGNPGQQRFFSIDLRGGSVSKGERGIAGTLWDPATTYGGGAPPPLLRRRLPRQGTRGGGVHLTSFFSRRGARRARKVGIIPLGSDRPGARSGQRIGVGSANVRSLKGDKFKIACHEFSRRRMFICGISEHWKTGSGVIKDEATGVYFIYTGHPKQDNSPSGKHGVGFLLSSAAHTLWQQQGAVERRVSPRVASISIALTDPHGVSVPFFFLHGYAPQQTCSDEEAAFFWGDMQKTMDSATGGATTILTMDINASIGIRRSHEDTPVCGVHGLERVSPAGERLKDWLSQNGLYAISTHFGPPAGGHGFGTWKHPRSRQMYQNDHIFVSRGSLKSVKGCRNFSPIVVSGHLSVKAVFRVAANLRRRRERSLDMAVRSLDYDVLRPFTPSFNPVIAAQFRESFRRIFHEPSSLPTCERGENAILLACVETPHRRKKKSADWYQVNRAKLDPLRDRMHAIYDETIHAAAQKAEG